MLMAEATRRMLEAARIGPGSRVLDVGTGTGDTALMAAERVGVTGHVLAIDGSSAMVEQARNHVQRSGLANVDLRQMDGARLQIDDASVDAVIGRNAMPFLPGWPHPLEGFYHVLRRGGRLSFIVFAPKDLNPYLQLPLSVAQANGWLRVAAASLELTYSLSNADQLKADLLGAGFRDAAIEKVVGEATTMDAAPLANYLRDGPIYRNNYDLLDDEEKSGLDGALEAAIERFRDGDGYRVQAVSLLASATC